MLYSSRVPPELEQLGTDVDSMRHRLLEELRQVQQERVGLADANVNWNI